MSDHSRSCTNVKDRNFNTLHHQSCMVHGADGFAFVLHSDPGGFTVVGNGGKHMGYGGLRKSIAVEFDTWYNPEVGDLFTDHVRCGPCELWWRGTLTASHTRTGLRAQHPNIGQFPE